MPDIVRNSNVVVGATNILLSTAKERLELIITNTSSSAQNITLAFGQDAAGGYGIFLTPFATYYSSKSDGFAVYAGEIYVISSAVAGSISIFERLKGI